ncbi:hypothetical protein D9758_003808 [Tetrapyrgos nigripes]|uniref:Inositol polyphosphate-related phosphatase domain-containing protein n=1 Tax=Tetrapyrgos nigripes TaxID=182062 RepID=A0A8H5GLS9_9AGAR|nr:hypothetical protein D9758_003808 [Tetrapyrgos nigripes]
MSLPSPHKPQITIQTPAQPTVLARLQGLFPKDSSATGSAGLPATPPDSHHSPREALAKALKIRIVTWNMHDSVPKGDLEELFGKVPTYTPSKSPDSSPTFPCFPLEDDHPYHLIIVAGQECPSTSGLPMGLGASFKLIDKEDRDREDKPRSSKHHKEDGLKPKKSYDSIPYEGQHPPSGWTSMTEDWLCHGGACSRVFSPSVSDISIPKPLSPRLPGKEPKRGPYQLLCKDRLLGIYLAVYVHRDLRSFVEDTSKSTVTAGLMGGRWGNKGGVGISVKIAGSSFLFLNCHLAAQQEKANLHDRLNDYAKIKSELTVDDFLSNDDSRLMAEDITDKFDYTFVFGDLNFRLDISRLHADWLISRQDYAQALAFDQLKNLMVNERAFVGFHEAPIDFPPTFKYDVLRTLKRPKRRGSKKFDRWRHSDEKVQRVTEVDEKELANTHEHDEEDNDKDDSEGEAEGEEASLASSAWTSMHSKHMSDGNQDEDYLSSGMTRSASVPGSKVSLSLAVHRAKSKWISLLSPTVPSSPNKWLKSKQVFAEQQATPGVESKPNEASENVKILVNGSEGHSLTEQEISSSMPKLGSLHSSASDDEDDFGDKGVYDSSSKKRVPSWQVDSLCDRILWKSTVKPEQPEDDADQMDAYSRHRTRVGHFLANAFRPLSLRSRRESYSSTSSTAASSAVSGTTTTNKDSPLPSPDLLESIVPFSRFVYPDATRSPTLLPSDRPLSADFVSSTDRPHSEDKLQRSSSLASKKGPSERHIRRNSTLASSNTENSSSTEATTTNIPSTPRWRFLPSFFTHNSTPSTASDIPSTIPVRPRPRKGEILCLNYDTLDDRGMRRLEGRSDHRPVIGSYAIYI